MKFSKTVGVAALAALGAMSAGADEMGFGGGKRTYEITITNLTPGISFTPLLVATHSKRATMFRTGQPASDALAALAEGGDTAPLQAELQETGEVLEATATAGLLGPGATVKVRVRASGRFNRVSIAGMLLPTNDGFVALSSFDLPWWDAEPVTATLIAYDAGSEPNDERCASIPGPHCGGMGGSPGLGGEGFVHVHNGIHGFADLSASTYDWRNPVAQVTIRRVN